MTILLHPRELAPDCGFKCKKEPLKIRGSFYLAGYLSSFENCSRHW